MDTTNLIAYLPFDTSTTQDKLGNTWTAYGSPTIEDGAIHLPSGAYLKANNIIDLNADKWTFHCKCRRVSSSGDDGFFGFGEGASKRGIIAGHDGIYIASSGGGSWQTQNSALRFPAAQNTWVHLAVVKDGTSLKFFEGGSLVWNATIGTLDDTGTFLIGGNSYGYGNDLYFDEILFYEGVALWTENFTPPTDNDYADLAGLITRLYVDVQRKVRRSITPVAQYVSFTGQSGCYGELPLEVLPGATTFTIEVKLATTSTKSSSDYWLNGHILGREIGGNWHNDFGLYVKGGKLCFWDEPSSGGSRDTYNTASDAVINDGDIHKVAVVSSNGAIDLYCDGELVAHTDNVNAKITDSAKILLAQNSNDGSYLQMDLYEARFWSIARTQEEIFAEIDGTEAGLEAWYIPNGNSILVDGSINGRNATLYGSPNYTCLNTLPVALRLDVARRLKFRYVNKGTADTLIISGTTLTNLPASKSQTGSAFYQTTRAKCFDIPAVEELWIKFDVYFNGSARWRAYNGGANGPCGATSQTNGSFNVWCNNNSIGDVSNTCIANTLQTVLLHMISDSTVGVIEAWVDGTKIYTYTGNVNQGAAFADFYLQSDGAGTFFSNVIISNVPVSLHEGFCRLSLDVERRIKNRVEVIVDVQREVLLPIVVPAIGEHFNHLVPSLKVLRDKARRIILPKNSVAYLRAVGTGIIRVFSDTDANGKITGGDFYSSGNMYAALANCQSVFIQIAESVTALQVIKALMQSLNETNLQGTAALDEAINYATSGKFETLAQLTDSFLSDLDNSASYTDFLETYCDIILDNDDTGAITGSDAGGDSIKTRYSIVPEPVPVEDWVVPVRGSSKIIDGLTVHFPLVGADGLTLSDAENHILAGLNSVWIEQSLKLVKDSFAFDFNDAGASVKTINVEFEDDEGHNALASIYHSSSGGKATSLTLTINMHYYANIITTSEDGRSSSAGASYLDRTLAHEFTHAVMAANINYFSSLPTWFKEGSAELVHGIDDVRASTIRTLLSTRRSDLETSLADGTTSNSSDPYAAGFMLLRYLGKQGQVQDNHFAPAALTISNLLISDGATDSNYNALTDNTRQLLFPDLLRTLRKSTALNFDVAIRDVIPVQVPLDALRRLLARVNVLPVDTSEYFPATPPAEQESGTPAVLPSIDDLPITGQNTEGIQSFEVRISENQITPQVSFSGTQELDDEQTVCGQYLDFQFQICVESRRQQGILFSYNCCSNLDALLYTQISPSTGDEDPEWEDESDDEDEEEIEYIPVTDFTKALAKVLSYEAVTHIKDYDTSWIKEEDEAGSQSAEDEENKILKVLQHFVNSTYVDAVREIFGWSSRVPTMLINVFPQDDKLYVIQRGEEENTIDITYTKHTLPVIDRELVRTVWSSSPNNETEVRSDKTYAPPNEDDDDEQWATIQDQSSGRDSEGNSWSATTTYFYFRGSSIQSDDSKANKLKGQLAKVEVSKNYFSGDITSEFTQITYDYDDDGSRTGSETYVHYTGSNPPPDTRSVNKLRYITLPNDEKFLAQEINESYEDDKLVDSTMTTHTPSRLGQSNPVRFADAVVVGVSGQNTGDDRATPYRILKGGEVVAWELKSEKKQTRTISGWTSFDTSFPISDESYLEQITTEIKRLNRSIKETVSLTIYDYPHLINLNDKITFNDNEYSLVSNVARTTSRIKSEQAITIVRWEKRGGDDIG